MGGDAELRLQRSTHGVVHSLEDREERVALGLDVPAPVRGDGVAEDPVVDVEQVGVRVPDPLEQSRGALDVGEQESLVSEWLHSASLGARRRGLVGAEAGVQLLVAA
jgi:hypothetical protein